MTGDRADEQNGPDRHLTADTLIQIELKGKKAAMGRYDTILWQIRSGYLLVLYGTLGFLVTKTNSFYLTGDILIIIMGFSVIAFLVDLDFRIRQLRVVKAYDRLVDSVIGAMGARKVDLSSVSGLLHISGESELHINIGKALYPAVLIYGGTALISIIMYVIL